MIDPAVTAAALKSAEANVASLEALAQTKAGTPLEQDARILVGAAKRITDNLRKLLATAERRTT